MAGTCYKALHRSLQQLATLIRLIPMRNGICYPCNPVAISVVQGMHRHSALYQTMLAELMRAFT